MASRAAGITTTDGGTVAVVRVVHGDRDSFSRSVDRAARAHIMYHMAGGTLTVGHWSITDADYASETASTGECVSFVRFELAQRSPLVGRASYARSL